MNLKLSAAGIAFQTAKGTPAAQPKWWGPVGGGGLVGLGLEQAEDELTSATVGGVGEYRESVAIGADWEGRAWPASIAAYLYAVLGAIVSTGANPYNHAITPAAVLPWVTVFGAKDTERKRGEDCKCDELKFEWEGNGPLKVTSTWAGLDVTWSAVAYVPVTDETLVDYLKGIGLVAVLDLNGAGYDGGATIKGGSIDIKRNLTADIKSGQLTPHALDEGSFECDVELKVRVPDLLAIRTLLTGAAGGTDVTATVPYGDFTLTFGTSPAQLALAATRVAFRTPDEPKADPKGGPGELTLQGRCYGNPAITATVINAVQSYTS